jgi:hypothetical protein
VESKSTKVAAISSAEMSARAGMVLVFSGWPTVEEDSESSHEFGLTEN